MTALSRGRAARAWGVVVISGVVVLGAACGGGSGSDSSSASGVDGRLVYAAKCAECHGANLEGTSRGPSHLSRVYEPGHHGDASFRRAIKEGSPQHHWNFGDMAPVQGLSDADINAVIAFVRAQQRERGFID